MIGAEYLPDAYLERMKDVLKEDFPAYLESFSEESVHGMRVNTGKTSPEYLKDVFGNELEPVPWVKEGFYYTEALRPAKHPYYFAGLYYLQEASAMTPGSILPITPGDRVLDLCGAPGGKATQLGMRLKGEGVLIANDISASRAAAMLKNIELSGTDNVYVTAETPEHLACRYPEYFDKILVDAPCSGEGMFRRDPGMVKDWLERGPEYYGTIQQEILEQAVLMLKPGGMLLFSTCTFSTEEDEGSVSYLLGHHSELELIPIEPKNGFAMGDIPGTVKLWPHRLRGEGHFLALFHKKGEKILEEEGKKRAVLIPDSLKKTEFYQFFQKLPGRFQNKEIICRDNSIYMLPKNTEVKKGIHYLRTGLLLGNLQKQRFTPSQALAMALRWEEYPDRTNFKRTDERVIRYLKGETLDCTGADNAGENGWCLICVDGFPLGWAKRNQNGLKNKYYPGWRWQ